MALGLTDTALKAAASGLTVKPNVALTPEYEAVNVTGVAADTVAVLTVKVADVEPCGTVTVTGTPAAMVFELESETLTPPLPAAAVRVTVPVPDCPPMITLGLTEMLLSAATGGLMVRPNVLLTPE